ncbi:DUF982 domain-containing protein [Mesorhizobium loti]|nr:DUF982 domain-containing protein [Mesorhizobium loti]
MALGRVLEIGQGMRRQACLGVLDAIKETRDARKAFVEAAKEVGILIEREPWG